MAALGNRIVSLLYPTDAVCIACGALRVDAVHHSLCRACEEALSPLPGPFCPRCGAPGWAMPCPDCLVRREALDGRASPYGYDGTARLLVRALKYGYVEAAANALADGICAVLPSGAHDAIVPIPLHPKRERLRGFNQARILAAAVSARCGLPMLDALVRTRPTKTQTHLTRSGRKANVSGAFSVKADVLGRSLLLLDDVVTTGATANACAEALKASGATRVSLATAARAPERAAEQNI